MFFPDPFPGLEELSLEGPCPLIVKIVYEYGQNA
jgi:hypothetical protein